MKERLGARHFWLLEETIKNLEEAVRSLTTKRRGRPRSVPQEGRATSNPRRDRRRRREAAEERARMDALVQALSDHSSRLAEAASRESRRRLWATMDALCDMPRADTYSTELLS